MQMPTVHSSYHATPINLPKWSNNFRSESVKLSCLQDAEDWHRNLKDLNQISSDGSSEHILASELCVPATEGTDTLKAGIEQVCAMAPL